MMPDDARTVERLEAELRQVRAENAALRQREAALVGELAGARAQQAATAEIVRIMSRPPTAAAPVFEQVAERAARLCDAVFSGVHLFDGARITLDAQHNIPPAELELLQRHVFPLRPERE